MPLAMEQHSNNSMRMKMWPVDQRLLYQQELMRASQENLNQARVGSRQQQLTREQQLSMLGLPVPQQGIHASSTCLPERQTLEQSLSLSFASASSQRYQLLLMAMQEQEQNLQHQYMQHHQQQQFVPSLRPRPEPTVASNALFSASPSLPPGSHGGEHAMVADPVVGGKLSPFFDELPSKTAALAPAPAPVLESQKAIVEAPKEADQPKRVVHKPKPRKKDSKWLSTLKELSDYKNAHGDCIVPRGYTLNPRLASWVAEQRKQYKLMKDGKQSSITEERVALLTELGFAWNAQEAAWSRHMNDLTRFRDETGHCNVPLNHPRYPKLGLWVKEQRRHYTLLKQDKQSHMTPERAAELDAIGFCWDTHEATWLERLRELTDYKDKHGNCLVPTNYTSNPKLGTWVHHQRRQYKKFKEGKACHITEERIRALESLGFVWYPRDRCTDAGSNDDSSQGSAETDLSVLDFRPRKRQRSF